MDKNITRKLRVIGNPADVAKFEEISSRFLNFEGNKESEARILIQDILDLNNLKVSVLYDGNSVYSKTQILRAFKRLLKNYSLDNFSDTLYKFFSLACGSIAHYNRAGWFDVYPTKTHLTRFFRRNEYGNSVLIHQPHWATDRIEIVKEMEKLLKIT